MLGLLSQPKQQSAEAVILTLCDRLSNSLLLEDRKAAVLSLRGLAHENRELVASSGLQGLLDSLVKDSHDPDAAKVTLETLLILFNTDTRRRSRNRRYISPLILAGKNGREEPEHGIVSDISLWLTDRLLHNEPALNRVLELADTKHDPFTAVYALQLVSMMTVNRPIETKHKMLSGTASLVTALGSVQDMVRDEALLLLNALTADHLELQKLVAFEGGFDKAFDIIDSSGGVIFGGRTVEDSLTLIANLIEYNTSNQKLFTEIGFVLKWTNMLQSIVDLQNEGGSLRDQSVANIESALAVGQLLCVGGADQTENHQNILCASSALTLTLQIAFGVNSTPPVRVSSLITAASLINANNERQDDFLAVDVPYYDLSLRQNATVTPRTVSVSQALFNWATGLSASQYFDLRCASLLTLSSAFNDNELGKIAFVEDQIEKYSSGNAELDAASPPNADISTTDASGNDQDLNLIEILAEYSEETRLNPFRIWFAAAVLMRLFIKGSGPKELLRKVKVGDESLGMEVHTLIQAVAGEMQRSLSLTEPTVALAYLQLLSVWCYDDTEAVDEFTRESSAVQALLAHQTPNPLAESLAAVTLGISYSFCTAQSSISRKDFHRLLTTTMGRDQYRMLIRRFRNSEYYQSFDELAMFGAPRDANGSPAVYLDAAFVGLMKESIKFIGNAIDSDPEIEPSTKVTFEMLDEIKHSLHSKTKEFEAAELKLAELSRERTEYQKRLDESLSEARKHEKSSKEHFEKLQTTVSDYEGLQQAKSDIDSELKQTHEDLASVKVLLTNLESVRSKQDAELTSLRASKEKSDEAINEMTRELFSLRRAKESSEKEASKLQAESTKLRTKLESLQSNEGSLKKQLSQAQIDAKAATSSLDSTKKVTDKLAAKLKETATVLQQREKDERELNEKLTKFRLDVEQKENELVTLRNREATTRKELDRVTAQSQLEAARIKESTESAAQADKMRQQLDSLNSELKELKGKLAKSEASSESLQKELLAATSSLSKSREEAQARENALETSNKNLKDINMKLVKDIAALKARESTDAGKQPVKQSESERLRNELADKQGALDDLMVLLDDLTERKSKYKAKLRELKQDVSDSEDDDDDDEDDEDEDDQS